MPKKVVIDRSRWLCGHTLWTLGPSYLLDGRGNMCCLGFVCSAEGVADKDMLYVVTPRYLPTAPSTLSVDKMYPTLTDLANTAMEYNDNSSLSKSGREKAIKQLFDYEGIYELEFVGEYPNELASSNTK